MSRMVRTWTASGPRFVTVIFQNAVLPDGITTVDVHGPMPLGPQLATEAEPQTCASMRTSPPAAGGCSTATVVGAVEAIPEAIEETVDGVRGGVEDVATVGVLGVVVLATGPVGRSLATEVDGDSVVVGRSRSGDRGIVMIVDLTESDVVVVLRLGCSAGDVDAEEAELIVVSVELLAAAWEMVVDADVVVTGAEEVVVCSAIVVGDACEEPVAWEVVVAVDDDGAAVPVVEGTRRVLVVEAVPVVVAGVPVVVEGVPVVGEPVVVVGVAVVVVAVPVVAVPVVVVPVVVVPVVVVGVPVVVAGVPVVVVPVVVEGVAVVVVAAHVLGSVTIPVFGGSGVKPSE